MTSSIENYFQAFFITLIVLTAAILLLIYYVRDLKRQVMDAHIREVIHRREETIRYQLLLDQIKQQGDNGRLLEDLQPFWGDKIQDIRQRYPQLTDTDCKVFILIGLGLENHEIIRLTDMSKRTYYKRRQLIAQRIGITAAQLDDTAQRLLTTDSK